MRMTSGLTPARLIGQDWAELGSAARGVMCRGLGAPSGRRACQLASDRCDAEAVGRDGGGGDADRAWRDVDHGHGP